jgi:hypothetical protein
VKDATASKQQTRRQLIEQARAAALNGQWDEAIAINQQLLDRTPRDAEAQNRVGRAYFELNDYAQALESYMAALKIDPANLISRRNLQRLDYLRHRESGESRQIEEPVSADIPRTFVFIEEVGKTWVDELVNPSPHEELAEVSPGEQLNLTAEGNRLVVTRQNGDRLGEVEPKTADRMISLMKQGNRYEVYALGLSPRSLRVILREVYRDPSIAHTVSFPRQISSTKAYLRERDMLRQRDEADFLFIDEDEEETDEEETGEPRDEDEEEPDNEATAFIDESITTDDEESHI